VGRSTEEGLANLKEDGVWATSVGRPVGYANYLNDTLVTTNQGGEEAQGLFWGYESIRSMETRA